MHCPLNELRIMKTGIKILPTLGSKLSKSEEFFWIQEAQAGTLESAMAQNPSAAARLIADAAWGRIHNIANCRDENYF